jgi:hypothetical protein
MLFKKAILDQIARGEVTLAFRRWRRPTVVAGGTLLTEAGLLDIRRVDEVTPETVTEAEARMAGFSSRAALMASLRDSPNSRLYRIAIRYAGADPRVALRKEADLRADDRDGLRVRLDQLDRSSKSGFWTRRVLQAIADHPDEPAGLLATALGVEKEWLKLQVRNSRTSG